MLRDVEGRRKSAGLLTLAVALLGAALLSAQEKDAPKGGGVKAKKEKEKELTAETIRQALDRPVTFELNDQPLQQLVNQMAEQLKFPIVIDRTAVMHLGIENPNESQASLKVKDVKLRSALRTLLSQYNLSFVVVGEALLITTEEMASFRQLRQRVNLDLSEVQLAKALADLGKSTGTNLVLDPRAAAKSGATPVTLKLDDVPLETAVRLMAEVAALKPVRMGNVLFVTSEDRADKLRRDADGSPNHAPGFGPAPPPGAPGNPNGPASE
jgi:hypothetical protein